MFTKRNSYNPKRRIEPHPVRADLNRLEDKAGYGGNPEHKKNPGDFGLTPPAKPHADKSLCDETGIFTRSRALKLLREGIRRGLVSRQIRNGYPQNIWAVTEEGMPVEAQLENPETGTYHGYPMAERDPFRKEVFNSWTEET